MTERSKQRRGDRHRHGIAQPGTMRRGGSSLRAWAVIPVAALLLLLLPAAAQQNAGSLGHIGFGGADTGPRIPVQHMVQGTVEDKAGKPVAGAIVHLKTVGKAGDALVVTDAKGSYRFSPLAKDTDYLIWAQVGEKKGPQRPISAFSTGPLTLPLKLE